MCSTVAPMARGGGGDITGNGSGQGFTSPSTCTHVQGVSGAPTAAVGRCRRRSLEHALDVSRYPQRRFPRGILQYAHSVTPTECAYRKKPREKRLWGYRETSDTSHMRFQRYRWGLIHVHLQLALSTGVVVAGCISLEASFMKISRLRQKSFAF